MGVIDNMLACDIGLRRIGLATQVNGIILPLQPIIRKNRQQASRDLSNLLFKRAISTLVTGIPSGGKAKYQEMQNRIRYFISLLSFDGRVVFVDEDYTSLEALEDIAYLSRESKIQAQKNGQIDSIAACKILQRYVSDLPIQA